jgi:hypothetical protein
VGREGTLQGALQERDDPGMGGPDGEAGRVHDGGVRHEGHQPGEDAGDESGLPELGGPAVAERLVGRLDRVAEVGERRPQRRRRRRLGVVVDPDRPVTRRGRDVAHAVAGRQDALEEAGARPAVQAGDLEDAVLVGLADGGRFDARRGGSVDVRRGHAVDVGDDAGDVALTVTVSHCCVGVGPCPSGSSVL